MCVIPIIEEELIELFFYAVEIIPHNLSGFFGVQTLQKLLARKGKRREKKKKKLDGDSRDGPWCRTAVSSNQLAGESPN